VAPIVKTNLAQSDDAIGHFTALKLCLT